jgi:peptidoglycan/LPS O-acetylase OafA/YrhL
LDESLPEHWAAHFLGHTWSLSTEEQFYVLWPTALFLLNKWFKERVSIAVMVLLAISVLWFLILCASGLSHERIYNGFDGRVPAIILGASLAFAKTNRVIAPLAAMALVIYFFMTATIHWSVYAAPLVWLISAVLVAFVSRSQGGLVLRRLLCWKPLGFTGVISYGIYLWHYPIFFGLVIVLGYARLYVGYLRYCCRSCLPI